MQTPAQSKDAPPIRIAALGDSLTAGWGLPESKSWPRLVERRLREEGFNVVVENAGVSGDTTAGGLARLDWTLSGNPHVVVVALGANDALRGLPPERARANLEAIMTRLQARKVRVLLSGMYAPPNLGRDYEREFNAIYPDLAKRYGATLDPFILEGVAGNPALNFEDGLHPNEKGVRIIFERLYPLIRKLAEEARNDLEAKG